jgi:NagD protein
MLMIGGIKGYLIDMDGVIYRGKELIPGAREFIALLQERNIPFLFLTNNSRFTKRDIKEKLNRMKVNVSEENIFTCAMATARFLARQKPHGTAFVIGEGGLLTALYKNGYTIVDHKPDFVVVGEGRTFNMENIDAAVQMIYDGAKLIGTNLDTNCPTDSGIRSGCGAIIQLLESATGKKALTLGKPSPIIMREAKKELSLRSYELSLKSKIDQTEEKSDIETKKELSLRSHEIAMIGDTMETDILGGMQMGFYTILVLSGGTSLEDLKKHAYTPNQIVTSIAEISKYLLEENQALV